MSPYARAMLGLRKVDGSGPSAAHTQDTVSGWSVLGHRPDEENRRRPRHMREARCGAPSSVQRGPCRHLCGLLSIRKSYVG